MSSRRARPEGATFRTWKAPDGWPLRRMDWPQPPGRPVRGTLLFANGRGDFIEKYLEACAHWHARGWSVIAFDWRSQGGSQGDRPGRDVASYGPMVADLAALAAEMDPSRPRVAIGHSMGGHLLLRTLVDRAPPLDAAVLVAPMIGINSRPLPTRWAPFLAELMCLAGRRTRPVWKPSPEGVAAGSRRERHLTSSPERYADELWWWETEPAFRLSGPTWSWLRAAYRSARAAFTPEKLRRITVPVFLIGTARDRLVDPQAIREAAGRIPGAELHLYPDAAHEILRESDAVREDALARIDAFIDRHVPTGRPDA